MDAPRNKRRYEDRMSSKLDNFHINDRTETSTVHVAEELQDWDIDNDIELSGEQNCVIEEPSGETSGEIVLSEQLRTYLDACNKQDDFSFLKKQVSGTEIVLYRRPRTVVETEEGGDGDSINDRIVEIQDWIETDDDPFCNSDNQYVTFPAASCSSSSSNSSDPPSSPPNAAGMVDMDGMYSNGNGNAGNDDSMEID